MNKNYISLLGIKDWIKNFIIFIPLFLSGMLYQYNYYTSLILAFICTSLISSSGYILNDLLDAKEDSQNPYKMNRPIPSEKVSIKNVLLLGYILLILPLILSINLGISVFLYCLICLDILYNFKTRNIIYLDIITLSLKYPIRCLIGYSIIGIQPNVFLLALLFSIAICLSIMKRKGEKIGLKDDPFLQRMVLHKYLDKKLDALFEISALVIVPLIYIIFNSILISVLSFCIVIKCIHYYKHVDYKKSKSLAILKDEILIILGIMLIVLIYYAIYMYNLP